MAILNDTSRRDFLRMASLGTIGAVGSVCADMTHLDILQNPALAKELKSQQKRVLLLWLAGGSSQLETWDPKPGAVTGGPFRAIPTSVPGIHISELMPQMAKRMKHTAIIRSLNSKNGDHGGGAKLMMRGRMDEANLRYPDLGAIVARELGRADSPVPDYVSFYSATEGRDFAPGAAGFFGARYNPMELSTSMMPENLRRVDGITEIDHQQRADLQQLLSKGFTQHRLATSTSLGSHGEAYQRVRGLMASDALFDISREPAAMRERYGKTQFGEQAIVSRRLLEAGVPFVRLGRAWWDSHGQNFETHQEMVPELDHVMATLIDDLKDRGLLDSTLIVTMAEFGRTPQINASLGRDHFASAWSVTLTGCGIQGGAVYGKTDDKGQTVKEDQVGAAEIFATIFEALGIPCDKSYRVGARPVPITPEGTEPIEALLA